MQQVCPCPCPAYFLLFYSSVQGEKSWPHSVWSWRMTPFPAEELAGRGIRCQLKSRGKPHHGEGRDFSQLPGASASPHTCCWIHVGKEQKPGHGTKPPWVKLRLPTLFFPGDSGICLQLAACVAHPIASAPPGDWLLALGGTGLPAPPASSGALDGKGAPPPPIPSPSAL